MCHRNRANRLFAFVAATAPWLCAQQDPPRVRYHPLAGMDPDGRIERPQLPDDLPNPERWRYTPPGRIMPGNVLERFLVSSFITPLLFREADIGAGGGIALTDIDFRNQDYREFANVLLTYSEEGQQAYRINWRRWLNHRKLDNGGVIRDERSILSGQIGYEKTLTRRFFGFGSRTDETAETSYSEEFPAVALGIQSSLPEAGDDLLLSAGVRLEHHELGRGRVSTVPTTDAMFAREFAAGDDLDQLWLNVGLAYDTRDSLHQPYRGWRVGVHAATAVQTGGEVGSIVGVEARQVFPLRPLLHRGGDHREENPPTDVLAVAAFVNDTIGDLPFHNLPTLGGSYTLRGYTDNRFTDQSSAHASIEYRIGLIPRGFAVTDTIRVERIGLAFFYEGGTLADSFGDLTDGRYLDSWGMGLRLAFAREASFRIDLGISDEDTNLILNFGNSF
ncbi:MAG: BamA/TamA family outer membrane protein [Planctomycetes bacterium]|nr:BamA/TamA family outer membrane protein [Planctomycetota bacterium]